MGVRGKAGTGEEKKGGEEGRERKGSGGGVTGWKRTTRLSCVFRRGPFCSR